MEDVDRIILHFLRQLEIYIPEDTKSLSELKIETIIESISKCLLTINPSIKVPKTLPTGISQRIEVAAQIAAMCKDLGYKNEVGYQTLLYYNEADLRQVFMFLIECLPTESDLHSVPSALNSKSLFMQNVRNKIDAELNRMWVPACCSHSLNIKPSNQVDILDCISIEKNSGSPAMEVDSQLMQTFFEMKEKITKKNLQPLQQKNEMSLKIDIAERHIAQNKEVKSKYVATKNLQELKEETILLKQKLKTLTDERLAQDTEFTKIQRASERVQAELNNIQNIVTELTNSGVPIEGGTENILKNIRECIERLHTNSDNYTMKILTLKAEIENNRKKLGLNESEKEKCVRTLQRLKEAAKSMKDEYSDKEKSRDQLRSKFEKLSRGNRRSIYTKRILEIINNVDKQKVEIKKILEDTRQIQKEINTLEAQLERSFSVADETLFKDAKKDDQAKKAYKLLALLHSECNTIVSLVNETGAIAREIVDLEDHIEIEKAKRTEDTLKRIQLDLTAIQSEKPQ